MCNMKMIKSYLRKPQSRILNQMIADLTFVEKQKKGEMKQMFRTEGGWATIVMNMMTT